MSNPLEPKASFFLDADRKVMETSFAASLCSFLPLPGQEPPEPPLKALKKAYGVRNSSRVTQILQAVDTHQLQEHINGSGYRLTGLTYIFMSSLEQSLVTHLESDTNESPYYRIDANKLYDLLGALGPVVDAGLASICALTLHLKDMGRALAEAGEGGFVVPCSAQGLMKSIIDLHGAQTTVLGQQIVAGALNAASSKAQLEICDNNLTMLARLGPAMHMANVADPEFGEDIDVEDKARCYLQLLSQLVLVGGDAVGHRFPAMQLVWAHLDELQEDWQKEVGDDVTTTTEYLLRVCEVCVGIVGDLLYEYYPSVPYCFLAVPSEWEDGAEIAKAKVAASRASYTAPKTPSNSKVL